MQRKEMKNRWRRGIWERKQRERGDEDM